MRSMGALIPALVMLATYAPPSLARSNTAQAQEHLRKACELVWPDAAAYRVERCTKRAMAAMSDMNRIRDNELKRLLVQSERDLETCNEELDRARDELTRGEASERGAQPSKRRSRSGREGKTKS